MRTSLTSFALASGTYLSLVLGACDDSAEDATSRFAAALESAQTLSIDVPGEDEGELGLVEAPLLGGPSTVRVMTSVVRRHLRQVINVMSVTLDRVTAQAPTRKTADGAVWVDAAKQRALVMRDRDSHFDYSVWGRAAVGAAWLFRAAGTVIDDAEGGVRGAVWVDLDVDPYPRSHGKIMVLWSDLAGERHIDVNLYDGTPDDDQVAAVTRNYRYADGPEGGVLAFDAGEVNVHLVPSRSAREQVRVYTRWDASGAVRGDYGAIGEDVAADGFRLLLGSECWLPPDGRITYEARVGLPADGGDAVALFEVGDRATCGFTAEEPPVIAPAGEAPREPARPVELDGL